MNGYRPSRVGDECRQLVRRVVVRHVMYVAHRRLDLRVAHVRVHVRQRERLHRERPERMPQIVEAHRLELRSLERLREASAQP
jgi:hypothetical protein